MDSHPRLLGVSTPTLLDHVERGGAVYRVLVLALMVAVAAVAEPRLLAPTMSYLLVAAAVALYAYARPNSFAPPIKATMMGMDAALCATWCFVLPAEPFVPALFTIVVLAWALVYGMAWGTSAALLCTATYGAVRAALGEPFGAVATTTGPMAVVLLSLAVTIAGLRSQLRAEWVRTRRQEAMRRAEAEKHLEQLERLAGTVAHEMNNSLTAILGLASLMRHDARDDQLLGDLDAMIRACRDGQRQVENLLGVAGRGELVLSPGDAASIARDALQLLHANLPGHVDVKMEVDGALPTLRADGDAIGRALLNLALNAAEATADPLQLRLSFSAVELAEGEDPQLGDGSWLRIDLEDDGPGFVMSDEVWDPLYSSKDRPDGVGLGLPYVQQVAARHRGAARLRSAPGEGTHATLWLPADALETRAFDEAELEIPMGVVLLVEDDTVVERAVVRMLHQLDHVVLSGRTGEAALCHARAHGPRIDTVICDLGLPDMDGADVLEGLREVLPAAHIVVSSGHLDPRDRSHLVELGADAFLAKPFGQQELSAAIDTRGRAER